MKGVVVVGEVGLGDVNDVEETLAQGKIICVLGQP